MLELKKISVTKNEKNILKETSVKIKLGDRIIFKGESGSGKSTLLKSILFFEEFDGEIFFDDKKILKDDICEYRNRFSYIGQNPLSFNKSVSEFLLLPFSYKGNLSKTLNNEKLKKYLEIFMFDEAVLTQKYNALSGGEKQRISLIQTLLLGKKIIVLDEITSALDSENKKKVIEELLKVEDLTLLIASHDKEWEICATNIVELQK